MAVSRTVKSRGKGQAETPASDSPATDIAPGAEAAPAEVSTAQAVASAGPEGREHGDTTESDASGSASADSLGDQASAEAVTAPPAEEASAEAAGGSSGNAGEAWRAASPELAAAAHEELQRLLRVDFEQGIDGGASCGIVLCVGAQLPLWRGGRFFGTGETHVVEPIDVTREQLARILAEPAFTCAFVPVDHEAASE